MAKDYKNKKGATGKKYTTVGDVIKVTYTDGSTRVVRPSDKTYAATKRDMEKDIGAKKWYKPAGKSKTTAETAVGKGVADGVVTTAKQKQQNQQYSQTMQKRRAQEAQQKAVAEVAKKEGYNTKPVQKVNTTKKNNNLADALRYGAQTGANNAISGIKSGVIGAARTAADVVGADNLENDLATQLRLASAKQQLEQQRINSQFNTNFGGAAKVASDVTAGAVGMLPTIGSFVLTPQGKIAAAGKAAQLGAKAIGFAPLALQSYGSGQNQALNEGTTINQANAYGAGNMAKELGTEVLFGGITHVPGFKNLGDVAANMVKGEVAKKIAGAAGKMAGEGIEEAAAEIADPFIKNATYTEDEEINWGDVAYSGLVGGLTAGALNTGIKGVETGVKTLPNHQKMVQNDAERAFEALHGQKMGQNEVQNAQKPQIKPQQAQDASASKHIPAPEKAAQNQNMKADFQQEQPKIEQKPEPMKFAPEMEQPKQNVTQRHGFSPENQQANDIRPTLDRSTASKMEVVEPTVAENTTVEPDFDYEDYDARQLPDDVFDFYSQVGAVGDKSHFNIRIVKNLEEDAEGRYDGNGNILISADRVNDVKTMRRVVAHEVYHDMKDTEEWGDIQDLAFQLYQMDNPGATREQMVQAKIDQYYERSEGRIQLDEKKAWDEIGAELMGNVLSDQTMAERIWNQNPSLAERIVTWLKEKVASIKSRLQGKSEEYGIYKQALEAYTEGLRNMEYRRGAALEGGTNSSRLDTDNDNANVNVTNEAGEVVAEQRGSEIRFSLGSHEDGGRDVLHQYVDEMVKKGKMDADFGKTVIEQLETMYKSIKKLTQGSNADKYSYFTAWSEVMPQFDENGKLILSVATPNGEYPMNLDFSTRCAKRVAIDTLLMHMSASGIYDISQLTPSDFAMINQILKDHNLATACTMCFVETKRDRSAGWANTIVDEYNELLQAANIKNGVVDEASLMAKRKEMDGRKENKTSMAMSERYAKYLRANANNPIQLKASDLMHSEGMERVKREAPDIYSIASSRYGAGTPKPLTAEGAYANELINPDKKRKQKGGKKKNPYIWKAEDAFKVGGVRLQSFSDFRVEMFFDYCQMIAEASLKGLPIQSYTKVPAFAKLFGMTGIKINLSLVPEVELTAEERAYVDSLTDKQKKTDARFKEIQGRAGLNSKGEYLWAGESFDPKLAYRLQDNDMYTNNVGTVTIGVSDAQIWQMLKDKNIRMIIPYHKSGIDAGVARAKNIDVFKNYESYQNHLIIDENLPMMPNESYAQYYRRLANMDKYGSKPTKKGFNFDFYGALKKLNDPVKVSKQYVDECQKRNIAPKFPQFVYNQDGSFNENYYKMLIDFAVYNKDGKYAPQQAVKFDSEHLPKDWLKTLRKELAIDESERKRMDSEIASVADDVVSRLKPDSMYSLGKKRDAVGSQEYKELLDEHGAMPEGENPRNSNHRVEVPRSTANGNRVRQFARNVMEAETIDDVTANMVAEELIDGTSGNLAYEPLANQTIVDAANERIAKSGWKNEYLDLHSRVRANDRITAEDIAVGTRLIQEAQKAGDHKAAAILVTDLAVAGTELGQSIQAFRLLKHLTPEGQLLALKKAQSRINKGLEKQGKKPVSEISEETMVEFLEARGSKKRDEIWNREIARMAQETEGAWMDKLNALRYAAMLSNPKTHIRNIVGNVVMAAARQPTIAISAAMEDVRGAVKAMQPNGFEPEQYRSLRNKTGQKYSELKRYAETNYKAFAKEVLESGGSRYQDVSGAFANNQRIFGDSLPGRALEQVAGSGKYSVSSVLEAEDMWFKHRTYVSALAGYMKANGITTKDAALRRVKPNGASIEKGEQYALQQAKKATFTEDNRLSDNISRLENTNTASKILMGGMMPFKRTPMNILTRGIEYSPVGIGMTGYKLVHAMRGTKNKMFGDGTGYNMNDVFESLAANMTGTALLGLGIMLAREGFLTGASGEDDQRKEWYDQQMGSQNFAVTDPETGDSWSIDWLAPAAMPLFTGVEVYNQLSGKYDMEDETQTAQIIGAVGRIADPVFEMSCMQGIAEALSSYSGDAGDIASTVGSTLLTSYGGQFIPAAFGAAARTVDDTVRSSYAPKDSPYTKTGEKFMRQQRSKLPYASMENEPSIDVWGNERKREFAGDDTSDVAMRALNNFFAPWNYSSNKRTELDDKLDELYRDTGESSVLPKSADSYIDSTESNPKVYLNASEYSRFATTQGEKSRKYVGAFVNSAAYRWLPKSERVEIISNLYSLAKYQAKKEALSMRGYRYSNSNYEKVLKSKMEPSLYYVTKSELDSIADRVSEGQKKQQISHLQELKDSGKITDEQFWYLRRNQIGKFSKAEMAACPYEWIRNM